MRDAIIYNRNNPSILFYECGNESISREHMIEMKAIRDKYDPHRSEEHTSELQSLREISYAVFCLKTSGSNSIQADASKENSVHLLAIRLWEKRLASPERPVMPLFTTVIIRVFYSMNVETNQSVVNT